MQVMPGKIVSQIKDLLAENGITYWFDEDGIYSGDVFARVIARNIMMSKIMLFISTENSNQSPWTCDEVAVAREYGKKIIPFRYDQSLYNVDVIIYLAKLDFIDYMANPNVALDRLLSSINEHLQSANHDEVEGERVKRIKEINDSITKHTEVLESFENEIIEHEKSLLELKYKRDKLNEALKELKEERVALLGFVPQHLPEVEVPESKTYRVGDYYDDGIKQGVVFEVWDDGKHGKIVSLEQSEEKLLWCTAVQYNRHIDVKASSSTDGQVNTDKVMKRKDKDEYPAFKWCRSCGEEWYLPAIDELKLLLNKRVCEAVNKTLERRGAIKLNDRITGQGYWSSTESSGVFCAWGVYLKDDYTRSYLKVNEGYVRAVATF
jgi:hypothetical protein